MPDNIEKIILERVCNGNLPMNGSEAVKIAPPERYKELIKANLICGKILEDNNGNIAQIIITSATHSGRDRLSSLNAELNENKLLSKAMPRIEKLLWMLAGVAFTLFTIWLANNLGLRK